MITEFKAEKFKNNFIISILVVKKVGANLTITNL